MANARQNVCINKTFSAEITDSEYLQVFSESNSTEYYEISSVRKEDPSNDRNISLQNIPSRQADIHGRQKIRISLWLLFPIIMCSLIAIVITGIVTFYITKEVLAETQFLDAHEADCYWLPWSSWSKCSITCGDGVQVRIRQQMDTRMCNYNETFNSQTCPRSGCPGIIIFIIKHLTNF
ncbi:unnamed protein product [Mytilus coruscus]|uniref:Uncharacterized protein n=1 Tax=Mytilus coruscus TaxID=42192 RepID=A0A6J8DFK8_MYTCO|nr:unnamed protein product [Mytilus coruscus]